MENIRFCSKMTMCVIAVGSLILVPVSARAQECRSEKEVLRAATAVERDLKKTIGRPGAEKATPAVSKPTKKKMSRKQARRMAKRRHRRGKKAQRAAAAPVGGPQMSVAKATHRLEKSARNEMLEPTRQVAWADFFDAVKVFSKDKGRCKVSKKEAERLGRILASMASLQEVPVFEIVAVEQLLNYATRPTKESWDSYLTKGSTRT